LKQLKHCNNSLFPGLVRTEWL